VANSYLAGALVRVATYTGPVANPTGGFINSSGVPADPSVVTLVYRTSETGTPTEVVYPAAPIVKDGVGLYHADLDTTGSAEAVWSYEWQGTGVVQAVASGAFIVRSPLS